jgi:superfamily II DNA or RNA helicase
MSQTQKNELKQAVIDIFGATPVGETPAHVPMAISGPPANEPRVYHTKMPLRDYQLETLQQIDAAEARGITRQVIHLPTGAGKTIVFSALVAQRNVRTLILVNREELVHQTIDKLQQVSTRPLDIGIVKAARNEHGAQIVVGMIQTLQSERRRTQLTRDFDLIVIDECHRAATTKAYTDVLTALGAFDANGPLVIGCTATPFRENGDPLIHPKRPGIFQEIVHTVPTAWMIQHGHLTPVIGKRITISDFDLSKVRVHHGDYDEQQLSAAMLASNAPRQIAKGFATIGQGRRSIVFCPTIGTANAMEFHLREHGFRAATVTGETTTDVRQAIYARLRDGVLDVIVNCMVLTEGFDEPSVDCIVLARPTRSKILFTQAIGRGLRPSPLTGKTDCLMIDATGCSDEHGLFSMAAELGLMKGAKPGEFEARDPQGESEHEEVDGHCTVSDLDLTQNLLRWVKTPMGFYVVTLGPHMLRIREDGHGTYLLESRLRQKGGYYQTRVAGIPLEYCFGIGTDTARDAKLLHMVRDDAKWRRGPRTPKQEAKARKYGIAINPAWNAGALSDAIARYEGDWYAPRRSA